MIVERSLPGLLTVMTLMTLEILVTLVAGQGDVSYLLDNRKEATGETLLTDTTYIQMTLCIYHCHVHEDCQMMTYNERTQRCRIYADNYLRGDVTTRTDADSTVAYLEKPEVLPNGLSLQYDPIDGGNWLIFQHRTSGSVDFQRNWADYSRGFGDSDNFWLGLEHIYSRCNQTSQCELRVDMSRGDDNSVFAKYGTFYIDGPSDNYRIHLSDYSGTAGDSMLIGSGSFNVNNMMFSTADTDRDNDNCGAIYGGGWWWWYNACGNAWLNNAWTSSSLHMRPFWGTFIPSSTPMTFTEMKMRRK